MNLIVVFHFVTQGNLVIYVNPVIYVVWKMKKMSLLGGPSFLPEHYPLQG